MRRFGLRHRFIGSVTNLAVHPACFPFNGLGVIPIHTVKANLCGVRIKNITDGWLMAQNSCFVWLQILHDSITTRNRTKRVNSARNRIGSCVIHGNNEQRHESDGFLRYILNSDLEIFGPVWIRRDSIPRVNCSTAKFDANDLCRFVFPVDHLYYFRGVLKMVCQ